MASMMNGTGAQKGVSRPSRTHRRGERPKRCGKRKPRRQPMSSIRPRSSSKTSVESALRATTADGASNPPREPITRCSRLAQRKPPVIPLRLRRRIHRKEALEPVTALNDVGIDWHPGGTQPHRRNRF